MQCAKFALAILTLTLVATSAAAQDGPVVRVFSNGQEIQSFSSITVQPNAAFDSAVLTYDVSDPQNDPVGCMAVVSNDTAAVNWTEADFNFVPTLTPWLHAVSQPNGAFGPDGTVHVVTLNFSDGLNTTQFSFTINVDDGQSGGGGSFTPGSPGGACAAAPGAGALWLLAPALWLLRRRRR